MARALVATAGLGAAAGLVYRDHGSVAIALGAFAGGATVVAFVASRRVPAVIGWSLPLVVIGATGAELHRSTTPVEAAAATTGALIIAAALIALAGPTPWRGRLTAHLAPYAPRVWHRRLWLLLGFAAAACATSALAGDHAGSTAGRAW